jgi:hypothetical protein
MRYKLLKKFLFGLLILLVVQFSVIKKTNCQNSNNRSEFQRVLNLQNEEMEIIEKKVLNNISELGDYLARICDRSTSSEDALRIIDLTIKFLFSGEDSQIQVSSKTRETVKTYKIRTYLNNLYNLPYNNIQIQWFEVKFTKALRQALDGKYYGTLEISQKFDGYNENKLIYSDITTKIIEVVVGVTVDGENGEYVYDLKIKNIGVQETF